VKKLYLSIFKIWTPKYINVWNKDELYFYI